MTYADNFFLAPVAWPGSADGEPAVGTSLPELTVSVMAALRRHAWGK
jgi:hypothetical protein